jgi:hypothetical protein
MVDQAGTVKPMSDSNDVCPVCGGPARRDGSLPYAATTVSCAHCAEFRVVDAFLPELAQARAGVGPLGARLGELSRALQAGIVTELVDENQVLAAIDDFVDAETTTE